MIDMLKVPAATAYAQIVLATLLNLGVVYCVKKSAGFTRPWPTGGALIMICLTQWLISRALVSGLDMGLAIGGLLVCVMIGSAFMGIALFGEAVSLQKVVGFGIAVLGIVIASLARRS